MCEIDSKGVFIMCTVTKKYFIASYNKELSQVIFYYWWTIPISVPAEKNRFVGVSQRFDIDISNKAKPYGYDPLLVELVVRNNQENDYLSGYLLKTNLISKYFVMFTILYLVPHFCLYAVSLIVGCKGTNSNSPMISVAVIFVSRENVAACALQWFLY